MATLTEIMTNLVAQRLCTQSTPTAECGESMKERSQKKRLKTQVENEEWAFVLEQVEEVEIIEEEVVEDLGDVECKEKSRVTEPSLVELSSDVEEGAQPPKYIVDEELEEVEQATSPFIDDDFVAMYDPLSLLNLPPWNLNWMLM
ncbi:uncharacterized protein DS421_18g623670 [Arachis hypogaea]|nr:uncharacterized protein DS421_18g623670 [Arachis hypogaea]